MGEVIVDLVSPVAVHHAAQFQVSTTEVTGISRIAVVGVETIKAAVIHLHSTTQLEAEFLVSSGNFQAAFSLYHDIGAVGSHGTRESLGGHGEG
ncbi:hypothetical protein D9M71_646590 [compost metagenome]